MSVEGSQVRAARALIHWGVRELAAASKVHVSTIVRIEGGGDAYRSTLDKLQLTLEAAGVEFIADGAGSAAGGPGVRMRSTT